MNMKHVVLTLTLFVNSAFGQDGHYPWDGWFASVSVTSTNLTVTFPTLDSAIIGQETDMVGRFSEPNEVFVFPHDRMTEITDGRHIFLDFIPVHFKNGKKGFRILDKVDDLKGGYDTTTFYLALSDTPVEVGEDDVKTILENGKWKKFKREAKVSSPSRKENVSPVNIAEDEQSEKKTRVSNRWLYALIPLCFLAILYFLRRKKR